MEDELAQMTGNVADDEVQQVEVRRVENALFCTSDSGLTFWKLEHGFDYNPIDYYA